MKLIDQYLLRSFLVPLAYCLLAFSMVYVIADLFDNLGDFIDARTPFVLVVKYYLILLPAVLYRIVPIAVMLAVIYALYNLSKNNELIAMRACGLGLSRLMVPFLAVGFCISLGVLAVNETIGPSTAYWCHKFVREQRKTDDPVSAHVFRDVAFRRDKEKSQRDWYINKFDTRDFSMAGISITQMRPGGTNVLSKTRADGGLWVDGRWFFTNVTIQAFDEDGSPHGAPDFFAAREMSSYAEKPSDFLNEVRDPDYLSSRELLHYIRIHRNLDDLGIARYRTEVHNRLAFPWASLIVVLLGIPVGTMTGRKGVMPAVAASLGMLASYYALMMFGIFLGKNMTIAPWLAGWLPILAFLLIGAVLIRRLR